MTLVRYNIIVKSEQTKPISPRPSLLTGFVDQSQPPVGWAGTNRVRWPVMLKLSGFAFPIIPCSSCSS